MRVKLALFLCSIAALPQLATAGEPSPQILGTAQAVADFCARVDPRDAAQYERLWRTVSNMPAAQLSSLESQGGFSQAYQQASSYLAKFSGEDAVAGCKALAGKVVVTKPTHGVENRPDDSHGNK